MALTIEQLGKKIKEKYPQYNDLSDYDVATKTLQKFPVYGDYLIESDRKKLKLDYGDDMNLGNAMRSRAVGAGKGVLSTARSSGNILSKLGSYIPEPIKNLGTRLLPSTGLALNTVSKVPESLSTIEQNFGAEEGTLTTPQNKYENQGFVAEQTAELFLPQSVATKGGKLLGGAIKGGSKLSKLGRGLVRAGTEGITMAGATAIQEESTEDFFKNAITFGSLSAAGDAVGAVLKNLGKPAAKLYNTAIKPTLDENRKAIKFGGKTLGEELLDRGMSGSEKSLKNQAITNINKAEDQLQTILASSNKTIKRKEILPYIDDLKKTFKDTPGMIDEVEKIEKVVMQFPKEVPLAKANEIKRNMYNSLRDVAFKIDPSLSTKKEAMKAVAKGIREQIEVKVGGDTVKNLNKELSVNGRLYDRIIDKMARENRNNILGLSDIGIGVAGIASGLGGDGGIGQASITGLISVLVKKGLASTTAKTKGAVALKKIGSAIDSVPVDAAGKVSKVAIYKAITEAFSKKEGN